MQARSLSHAPLSHAPFAHHIFALLLVSLFSTLLTSCAPVSAQRNAPAKGEGKAYPVAQPKAGQEVATFAAGCFWSIEAMFKQLKGVSSAQPGYAGGDVVNPSYEQVCSTDTGHAETVNIIFDPKIISYAELVEVFLMVHNPTTRDRQGPDEGPQYRSIIFYRGDAQKKDAETMIGKFTVARVWRDPIVTDVLPYNNFYRAEDYHLDYFNRNPRQPYCARVIAPKIKEFRAKFKTKLKN